MNSYTPAIITASVALFAALASQFLAHFLNKKREKRNDFMIKYQELFSELLAPLSIYIAIKTNPRRIHDVHFEVDEGDLLDNALTKLEKNLKHISPITLGIYERLYGYAFHEDGWGASQIADKHVLVYFVYSDILRSNRNTGIFKREDRKRLEKQQYHFGLLAMCLNFFDMDESSFILSMENFSGLNQEIKYKNLSKLLIEDDRKNMIEYILFHISHVDDSEKDTYQEYVDTLKKHLQK